MVEVGGSNPSLPTISQSQRKPLDAGGFYVSLLQPAAAIRAIAEFRRHIYPAVRAVSERDIMVKTPQVFRPDSSPGIFLELPADEGVQFVNAAAAGSFDYIPCIPPERRYEKYVQIPVCLMDLVPGQFSACRTYDVVICPYVFILVLYAKNPDEEHMLTLLETYMLLPYIPLGNASEGSHGTPYIIFIRMPLCYSADQLKWPKIPCTRKSQPTGRTSPQ